MAAPGEPSLASDGGIGHGAGIARRGYAIILIGREAKRCCLIDTKSTRLFLGKTVLKLGLVLMPSPLTPQQQRLEAEGSGIAPENILYHGNGGIFSHVVNRAGRPAGDD